MKEWRVRQKQGVVNTAVKMINKLADGYSTAEYDKIWPPVERAIAQFGRITLNEGGET